MKGTKMEKWKKALNRILYPPLWLAVILVILCTAAMVFIKNWDDTPVAYAVYVASFYLLCVLTAFFAVVFPKKYKEIRQQVYAHPLGNKYMTDASFKVRVSLFNSLVITLAYSVFNLASGVLYASLWFCAIAIYYILLSVIRFILFQHLEKKKQAGMAAEYRSYRTSAVLMMLLNLTLAAFVRNMIVQNDVMAFSDIYVITSATFTFYFLTMSIVDIVRYRKYNSPVMSAAKAIRFAQALVSLLTLEASMLAHLGDSEAFKRTMLSCTGAGVCGIVLSMSVYMIIRATKEIKRIQSK